MIRRRIDIEGRPKRSDEECKQCTNAEKHDTEQQHFQILGLEMSFW